MLQDAPVNAVGGSLWRPVRLCFSLQSTHQQLEMYKRELNAVDDYERRIRLLRAEVSHLSTDKAVLQDRCAQVSQRE